MKTRWWLVTLSLVFTVGWFSARGASGSATKAADASQAGVVPKAGDLRHSSASDREPSLKRWAEKVDAAQDDDLAKLIKDLPPKDRAAAIEAWLNSSGSQVLDPLKLARLSKLIDAWVAEDVNAVVGWAGALEEPRLRGLALVDVAGALAASDPQRAFECLVNHGPFENGVGDSRLGSMMTRLSTEAMKQGPEALMSLWQRLPDLQTSGGECEFVEFKIPPGTDFRNLLEGGGESIFSGSKPFRMNSLSAEWMGRDPEAATGYLKEKIATQDWGSNSWWQMYFAKGHAVGNDEANQWACDLLPGLPAEARSKFILESTFLCDAGRFAILAQNGESAPWINEALQYGVDQGGAGVFQALDSLPEAQRIDYLKSLRGEKAAEVIGRDMTAWKFSEAQQAEIRQAILGK